MSKSVVLPLLRALVVSALLVPGACTVPSLEMLEAEHPSSCSAQHPCVAGYACVAGHCHASDAGTPPDVEPPDAGAPDAGTADGGSLQGDRRVLVVALDPLMPGDGGMVRLSELQGWTPPAVLAAQVAQWWNDVGEGTYTHVLVDTLYVDTFPVKTDDFAYTPESYLAVLAGAPAHANDDLNFGYLLADHGICERANAGEFNEVWLFGGPWFGLRSMTMAGPSPFALPQASPTACTVALPIMGLSYSDSLDNVLWNFGERVSTFLSHAHGGESSDSIRSPWDLFTQTDPGGTFGFRGCGSLRRAPNTTSFDKFDSSNVVQSVCEDFRNEPLPAEVLPATAPVSCTAWGCTTDGYRRWWWAHAPKFNNTDLFGRTNNWLSLGLDPSASDEASRKLPCGWLNNQGRCANTPDCRWSTCASACVPSGVSEAAVGCTCPAKKTLTACDAAAGCAWYRCQVLCQAQGIPITTGCGTMPP